MSTTYEELDVRQCALGELVLRRRTVPGLGPEPIYEIKLNDDLLMSSWLNESEQQLSLLALADAPDEPFDVLVGGLGLGYTAWAALGDERARSVTVVDLLPEVIEWHQTGLVPLGASLCGHERCTLRQGDFFALVGRGAESEIAVAGGYGAILVDIDHAPDAWLGPAHGRFYERGAMASAAALLSPGGVFALWSAGATNDAFTRLLSTAFADVATHEIVVFNPMIDDDQTDTIYVATNSELTERR